MSLGSWFGRRCNSWDWRCLVALPHDIVHQARSQAVRGNALVRRDRIADAHAVDVQEVVPDGHIFGPFVLVLLNATESPVQYKKTVISIPARAVRPREGVGRCTRKRVVGEALCAGIWARWHGHHNGGAIP